MTHLKMTHCFSVCVWKCLFYFFPPFYLGTNGPFPMSFEVMMIPLLYFRWAAYVPSGSPESWHWQCQTMQGWKPHGCQHQPRSMRVTHIWQHPGLAVPISCLGKAGGGWLREFLWPHSHFSQDFVSEKSWVLKHLFSGVFGCGFDESSKVLFQIHFTLHLETLVVAEPAGVYMLCIFSHRDTSHWWISSTAIYWSVWLLKCICTCYSASIRVLDVCDARNL